MAQYAYKAILYKNSDGVIGIDPNNDTWLADYETNRKSSTIKADSVSITETTFFIDKAYDDFDSLIVSPIDWGDVKQISTSNLYELYLVTSEPLE